MFGDLTKSRTSGSANLIVPMLDLPNVLVKIVEQKRREVEALYASGLAEEYKRLASGGCNGFAAAISAPRPPGYLNLIAEFKRASPSAGKIRPDAEPEQIARLYERCGAVAVSVLTDQHFDGNLEHLKRIRSTIQLPILRKDFIIDPAQVYESRVYGADCILLIARLLTPSQIKEYIAIADSLDMDCLVEAHNKAELETAVRGGARLYGINNRDLDTFSTDLQTTLRLLDYVPKGYPIVTESGIKTREHVAELSDSRVCAMLVGETIMRAPTLEDMERKVYELLGKQD